MQDPVVRGGLHPQEAQFGGGSLVSQEPVKDATGGQGDSWLSATHSAMTPIASTAAMELRISDHHYGRMRVGRRAHAMKRRGAGANDAGDR